MRSEWIYWTAALLDGEGHFSHHKGSPKVSVKMTDLDTLEKAQSLWGGSIYPMKTAENRKPIWTWCLYSKRAIGCMMTVFPIMCGRRQGQIESVVKTWRQGRQFNSTKTHCPKGHPYSGDNLYSHGGKRYCKTCIRNRGRG